MSKKIERHFLDYQGGKLSYLDGGKKDGPVLLFTHATGFAAGCYRYFMNRLSSDYRVVGLDFGCHGSSSNIHFDNWLEFRNQILFLIDTLELKDVTGIGHSLGAANHILASEKKPGAYRKLIAMDPSMRGYALVIYLLFFDNPKAKLAKVRRDKFKNWGVVNKVLRRVPMFARFNEEVFADFAESCFVGKPGGTVELACERELEAATFNRMGLAIPPLYKKAAVETHFILPDRERVCSVRLARRILGNNAQSTIKEIKGGHLFPFEDPEGTLELLKEYLPKQAAPTK